MHRLYPSSRFASLELVVGALVVIAALPAHAQQSVVPATFLAKLQTAINKSDSAAMKSLVADSKSDDYSWLGTNANLMGAGLPWQVKVLSLPGSPATADNSFIAVTKYHQCESAGDHLFRIASTPEGPKLGAEIPETDTLGTRVRSHILTVRLDVPKKQTWISDLVRIDGSGTLFPACILRINAIYHIDSIRAFGTDGMKPVPYRQAGGFIAISVQPERNAGGTRLYDLRYHGTIEDSPEDYIKPNQAALTGYWYPHTGRLPASSEVKITVPRGWTAIGQGEATGKSVSDTETTFGWKNTIPVSYLTVAAGKYAVTARKIGNIQVSTYFLRDNPRRAQAVIGYAGAALAWFSKNFCRFPYSRYAVVETTVFPAALECYSFTLCGAGYIPMAVVHEISHTWWGGIVPCTYTRSMWNESFAEYSDGLYGRQTGAGGMHEFNAKLMSQTGFPGTYTLLTAKDAMEMQQSMVGYGKGSLVLENLERMLGTPKMLACMQRFIADHLKKRPGEDAEWQDFIDAVGETAGEEWRGFFPAWLTRSDLPSLHPRDVHLKREDGAWTVTGSIAHGEAAYWMEVPLVLELPHGKTIRKEIAVRHTDEPFRITVVDQPKQVALDPDIETLRAGVRQGAAPTLLGLQAASGPLLVIYANGGTTDENAANRAVAETQIKDLFPFAELTIKPDREIDTHDLGSANILVIGRTESLKLPASVRDALPLRATATSMSVGTQVWSGADLWGIAVISSPFSPKKLLGHAAGTGPEAIRNFRNQGDLDSLKGVFVIRGANKVLAAESAPTDNTTVVTLSP